MVDVFILFVIDPLNRVYVLLLVLVLVLVGEMGPCCNQSRNASYNNTVMYTVTTLYQTTNKPLLSVYYYMYG